MNIAICDDEINIREFLERKILNIYPEAKIYNYQTGESLIWHGNVPDILFLDIQMPGRNGMEIAKELREKSSDTIIIFITALEEYVFEAFDVGAFHYLVKPFTDEKFEEVLNRAVEQYTAKEQNNTSKNEKYIMINHGKAHSKVMVDDIVYAEVFNRKIVLHKLNEEMEYYGKLSDLEKQVGDVFFRTHRSFLINFKYVEKYDNANIYLENGVVLLAKQKYADFVKQYMKYNQRR